MLAWSRTSSATGRPGGRALRSLSANGREVVHVAAGEDQIGSGARESAGEVLAEAAAGAGHERDLSGEIEE